MIWPALVATARVGDGNVLGFAGTMRHDASVTCLLCHLNSLKCLGKGTDLVYLNQDGVGAAKLDALGKTLGVGYEQVVANQLNLVADAIGESLPAVPILFGHAVLNGDDGVLLNQSLPVIDHLSAGKLAALASQNILAGFSVVELGGSRIHGEHDVGARLVACLLACLDDVLQRLFVGGEVGSEAAFVANTAAKARLMQDLLQGVVDLCAPTQCLSERGCANGHDHELLEVHVVVCVLTAVEDVHHGRGQHVGVCAANVLVKRKLGGFRSSLRNGKGCAEDGVCAEVALVFGAVKLAHDRIDAALVVGFHADKRIGNLFVHVGNSVQRALAQITLGIAIAKFHRFECAGGCTGRNSSTTCCIIVENNLNLNRGVATGVKDLTTEHIDDGTHVISSLETFAQTVG